MYSGSESSEMNPNEMKCLTFNFLDTNDGLVNTKSKRTSQYLAVYPLPYLTFKLEGSYCFLYPSQRERRHASGLTPLKLLTQNRSEIPANITHWQIHTAQVRARTCHA